MSNIFLDLLFGYVKNIAKFSNPNNINGTNKLNNGTKGLLYTGK